MSSGGRGAVLAREGDKIGARSVQGTRVLEMANYNCHSPELVFKKGQQCPLCDRGLKSRYCLIRAPIEFFFRICLYF
jgi:hypothetical protein